MNFFDIYFSVMGGSPPPPPPAYRPPPRPLAPVAPGETDEAKSRKRKATQKRSGRTSLITNVGGATGLGEDDSGRKKTLGGR